MEASTSISQLRPDGSSAEARHTLSLSIANSIVHAHKQLSGRGPTKARAVIRDNVVTCVLADALTTAERTLVQHGRPDAVARLRYELHLASRPTLIRVVEELTQRRVVAFASGIDAAGG